MMESKPYGYNPKDLNYDEKDNKAIILAEIAELASKGLINKKSGRALFKSKKQ